MEVSIMDDSNETRGYKRFKIILNLIILIVGIGIVISYSLSENGLGYSIIGIIIVVSSLISIYRESKRVN